MHYLFEPVHFGGKPLLMGSARSVKDFAGFYHWHQCGEILYVQKGRGSVIVNRKTYEIAPGMLFFFQPFQLHKVYANVSEDVPYVRSVIHFDPFPVEQMLRPFAARHALFVQLWKGLEKGPALDVRSAAPYFDQAFAIYEQMTSGGRHAQDEDNTMLMLQMMHGMLSAEKQLPQQAKTDTGLRPVNYAETIMQWIEEHYTEDIKLDDVAEALHLSKFYISRLFQRETGSSISHYVTARRIKQACRLLQTTKLPIERIGIEVGIPNPSYFIRLFKKVVGTTPLKYRIAGA